MALDTVQDYLDRARVLLLDQIEPYRYEDTELVEALNYGIMEMRRIRPDILKPYLRTALPEFNSASPTEAVLISVQYRTALLYYICGHAQLRDDENNQDSRAAAYLNKFVAQLTSIMS